MTDNTESATQPSRKVFSIELAYEGTGFLGWQLQPEGRTVQRELGAICSRILDQPVTLVGAGRTDTGVHARASLCSFEALTTRTAGVLFNGLRRLSPPDIRIRRVDRRPAGFSARFSARAREYEYRILRGEDPFQRRHAWCTSYRLDVSRMQEAMTPLTGIHDCRGLCVAGSVPPRALCEFQLAELSERGRELVFRVRCNRFLHSMVRSLAGTLHDIGRGRFASGRMLEILETGDRTLCGQKAPPQGLYLDRVYYEDFRTGDEEGWSDDIPILTAVTQNDTKTDKRESP